MKIHRPNFNFPEFYLLYFFFFLISGVLACNCQYLVTGSVGQFLKLWSIANICPASENSDSQVVMECQMRLDGAIIAAAFDDDFEMVCFGYFFSF